MILGYLVPEFPGQTHIMFWRELAEIERQEIAADVVSTRRPVQARTHEWSDEAAGRTTYLSPVTGALARQAVEAMVRAGPRNWIRWSSALLRSERAPGIRGLARMLGLGFAGAALAGIASRRKWDHLHVHSCADAANVALFASCLGDLTYSITLHGPLGDYGPNQRMKWQHAAAAIVITEALRVEVDEVLAGSLPPSIRVVGMGVQPAALNRSAPYRPWQAHEMARLFSCARLNPAKGHVDAITAVAALRESGIDAELVIAGEDDEGGRGYRAVVERHIAGAGLEGSVHLLGAVSEDEVRRQLELAHVFLLASRAEPLGVAIMEAMAMQVPVVVTRAGGVTELVEHGVDGFMVPPESPAEFAAVLRTVLDDGDLASRVGALGRATIVKRFTSARNAEVLIEEMVRAATGAGGAHDFVALRDSTVGTG